MKIFLLLSLLILDSYALSTEFDCIYSGRGEVYEIGGNHLPAQSFDLYLERTKAGPGQYIFNEIKTFSDGSSTQLTFVMGWYIGNFSFDNGAGRVVKGRCLDYGYCVGKNEFPGFKGTFVTRFNNREILTTTTTDSLIVDEVVKPKSDSICAFE